MTSSSRLQVAIAKTLQSLPETKRSGENVLEAVSSEILYNENSINRSCSFLAQEVFLSELLQRLQEKPDEVIAEFEKFRDCSE